MFAVFNMRCCMIFEARRCPLRTKRCTCLQKALLHLLAKQNQGEIVERFISIATENGQATVQKPLKRHPMIQPQL